MYCIYNFTIKFIITLLAYFGWYHNDFTEMDLLYSDMTLSSIHPQLPAAYWLLSLYVHDSENLTLYANKDEYLEHPARFCF